MSKILKKELIIKTLLDDEGVYSICSNECQYMSRHCCEIFTIKDYFEDDNTFLMRADDCIKILGR